MKVLLAAVNAKYIHTSLSVRTLAMYAKSDETEFCEYTINEQSSDILRDIYEKNADAVLFSCYIWNISMCLEIAQNLKKVSPGTIVILGGPEVTFDDTEYMEKYTFIDGIIRGEGEVTFSEWLKTGMPCHGMTYRIDGEVVRFPDRELIHDISDIPFPYTKEDIEKNKNKLIYYESSRGCPFKCSYCLSSTVHSVRFRNIDMVKEELKFFADNGVRIVKFVDRTFNADRKRTCDIIRYLIENGQNTTFHFEVAADIMNDELIKLLKKAPDGMFQLEVGVQTTNTETIRAIDRKTDFEAIRHAVESIKEADGVHVHLDLIAGLPGEDIESFKKSFDDVYRLGGDVLQLGFLKLLRGTKIRNEEEKYGYVYTSQPPYEILKNDFITFDDILLLKGIEEVFERYSNSNIFVHSIKYLLKQWDSPFEFFKDLWRYYKSGGFNRAGQSRRSLYDILAMYCKDELFRDILKLDYFIHNAGANTPAWSVSSYDKQLLKARFEILSDTFIKEKLPEYENLPVKETVKYLHFEKFDYDVLGDKEKRENIIIFDNKYDRRIRVCRDSEQ